MNWWREFLEQLSRGGQKQEQPKQVPQSSATSRLPAQQQSLSWAQLTRQYLALGMRKPELLEQAIREAERAGEAAIAQLLRAFQQGDWQSIDMGAATLLPALQSVGRGEEALTVALVMLLRRAALVDVFMRFPPDQQAQALQAGLQACEESLAIARALNDLPCMAFYHALKGAGYSRVRRYGEAAEALEEALGLYRVLAQQQPEVYNPYLAVTLNNLGNALDDLRRYDEAVARLEEALGLYRELAQQRPELHTPDVAKALTGLGTALRGIRQYEKAVISLKEALKLYQGLAQEQPDAYNLHILIVCNNLGNALCGMCQYEEAIEVMKQSIQLCRKLVDNQSGIYSYYLAVALTNFGNALRTLSQNEQAFEVYEEASLILRKLTQHNSEFYSRDLAVTLTNLGTVLRRLHRHEEARKKYEEALEIYRRISQSHPEASVYYTAVVLNNLGTTLAELQQYTEAEKKFREAQDLIQNWIAPDLKANLYSNLGRLLMKQGRWGDAIKELEAAVQQVEQLRTEVLSLKLRETVMRENIDVFDNLIVCLMHEKHHDRALEVAEQGKSRTLIDLLTLRDLRPQNAPPDLVAKYEQMLFRARALEDALRRDGHDGQLDSGQPREERVAQLQQERWEATKCLNDLVAQIRQHDPDFLPHAKPLNLTQIRQLARNAQSTLLMFRVTNRGSFAFLVYPDGETEVVQVPDFTTERLYEMLVRFEGEEAVDGWVVRYYDYQEALVHGDRQAVEQARRRWLDGMDATLGALYQQLLQPVHARLREKGVQSLVIVPNKGLAIVPLHACWWEENGVRRYLMDEYEIRYAPSLTIFNRCYERERAGRDALLGVVNPKGDLVFSEWEGKAIERLLGDARCLMLRRKEATKQAVLQGLQGRGYLHFACHGEYRLDNPLESALQLADGELTLGEILERVHLPQAWLVVLSACETGLVDFREIADEHYGLPVGFLYAGAPTVYGSLWMVYDPSTALLMMKAYELLEAGKPKGAALREAQLWLRDLTRDELFQLIEQEDVARRDGQSWRAEFEEALPEKSDSGERPFAHPYYWAGFQCVGV